MKPLKPLVFVSSLACLFATFATGLAQAGPITLHVDATGFERKLLRARLEIPAQPGELTLVYPKWIPGEHGPTGPINQLVDLQMRAGQTPIAWRRDAVDMYALHLTVPAGATNLEVSLGFLLTSESDGYSSGASVTPQLLDLSWNQLLLYPQGAVASQIEFAARLRLPAGWKFGTALPVQNTAAGEVQFAAVSLERLVDSPLIAGKYFRSIDLTPGEQPAHYLDMVADSAAALAIKPETVQHFRNLVAEAGALFGSRHYRDYHFLLTLSDHVASFGLEHHESSDNRTSENSLTDDQQAKDFADLLPHELVHSWNGKYRRPAGLATPDYQKPMMGDLLWVYEGLTEYLGMVLATRSGLWTPEDFKEAVAINAARMDQPGGRTWRSLADTTAAAQLLNEAPRQGAERRRMLDYYPEGVLIWLEADSVIWQVTHGEKSLDDFCRLFHGGGNGAPAVVTYDFDDVTAALNQIAPYDWKSFFQKRIYEVNSHAPLGGIANCGWRVAYTNEPTAMLKCQESVRKFTDQRYSLGIILNTENGSIRGVIPDSPADHAGVPPDATLVAVNDRSWTPEILRHAVSAAATNPAPIQLLVKNTDYYKSYQLDYRAGEKYPWLERVVGQPDLLSGILDPIKKVSGPARN